MFEKLNWSEYKQRLDQCESIICIGAGKRISTIQQFFDDNILNKIKYVADNDVNKQGDEIDINGRQLIIKSIPSLFSILNKNVVVLITVTLIKDILEQLNGYNEFDHISIFAFNYIYWSYLDASVLKKEIPADLKLCDEMLIPKKIHYCWFGKNPIPERYKRWMRSWGKYCPDYEIIEWNEDNYDITKNKYMLQAYEAKKWGFVPDYARLDIIYNHGGIYLDTDVELLKNLDELLYQRGFAGFQMEQQVALGLGFGAVAGNKFIKGMLDVYERITFMDESGNLDLTPSPRILTEYLINEGLQLNGEYQVLEDCLTIYPEKVLNGKNMFSKELRITPNTFSIHHFDGSWQDDERKAINELKIV